MKNNFFSLVRTVLSVVFLFSIFSNKAFAAEYSKIPDGWSDGYVYANGIRIHYYQSKQVSGKPVILAVHGVMDTGLTWASVVNKLQKDYNFYMLDTRGHGLTDPFTGLEDRNTLLKDVIEAAKSLKLEKPILMGHSMGGAIVIRLGAEYPEFAKSIIVVDAGIGGGVRKPQSNSGSEKKTPQPTKKPDPIQITMWGSPEALVKQNNYSFDDLTAKAHRDNPRWSIMDCNYWATAIKQYHGPYSNEMWQTMSGSMRGDNALSKIQVPLIILKADAIEEVRKAQQQEVSLMQNVKLIHIDNSGHNVQRDQPEKAASFIKEFLL